MPFDNSGQWFLPTTVQPSDLHAPLPSGHPYESLMPSYNLEAPGELLVRHYGDRRNVPDWTDPRDGYRNLWEQLLHYRSKVRAPTGSQGLAGHRERPSAKPVPVALYGAGPVVDSSQTVVIEFKDRDERAPSKGIHLGLLLGQYGDPARLQGAKDIVLGETNGSGIEFVIAWPGYRPREFKICTDGGPLTRFGLASQITVAYAVFFRRIEQERLVPSAAGCNIALLQGPNARPDTPGIQLMHLHLVRIRKTSGGCWVADVEIVWS